MSYRQEWKQLYDLIAYMDFPNESTKMKVNGTKSEISKNAEYKINI